MARFRYEVIKLLYNLNMVLKFTSFLSWDTIKKEHIFLYAGNIPDLKPYEREDLVGLSINRFDYRTMVHDITEPYPLPDSSIDCYQAEDVLEHIPYGKLPDVINEIYRILRPAGYFRMSVPDYACDILYARSVKDRDGKIIFDPFGGGKLRYGKVVNGGHLWFPTYKAVKRLVEQTHFRRYKFLHYYAEDGTPVTKPIDYSMGWIQRTPDHDERVMHPYRPMSIVVDLYKD